MSGRLGSKKTIIITGGLGFIGSHFMELCLSHGHSIICYDKETYAANLGFNEALQVKHPRQFSYRKVDISDVDDIPSCDIIVNFAAESHVDNSINGNDVFMKSNVIGVHRMLEILKNKRIENLMHSWVHRSPLFVQISTDEVFGDIEQGFFKEDDRHRPSNPYAATKSAAEQLVVAWGRTYGLPFLITRSTNNYGPRQHTEKLIPRTITRLLNGKKAIIHGNGLYRRNWIHVSDNVDAIFTAIDKGDCDMTYNISSDEEYSVNDIVQSVCDQLNLDVNDWVDRSTDRSGADVRYALDCSRLKDLGWRSKHQLDISLPDLIDYHRFRMEKR